MKLYEIAWRVKNIAYEAGMKVMYFVAKSDVKMEKAKSLGRSWLMIWEI
jgi:hypothetical protein